MKKCDIRTLGGIPRTVKGSEVFTTPWTSWSESVKIHTTLIFTNKRPVRLEEAGEKTLNMKGDGIYLFMAAGPLLRSSWEKSRGKVAPSVWLRDSGECRWKPEWLEIAIIRFDHVVEEQHWNSEAEALNQISAEMMDFFFSSNAVFIFHSKLQQKTSEDIDLISIDLSRCIGLVYLTSTSI